MTPNIHPPWANFLLRSQRPPMEGTPPIPEGNRVFHLILFRVCVCTFVTDWVSEWLGAWCVPVCVHIFIQKCVCVYVSVRACVCLSLGLLELWLKMCQLQGDASLEQKRCLSWCCHSPRRNIQSMLLPFYHTPVLPLLSFRCVWMYWGIA